MTGPTRRTLAVGHAASTAVLDEAAGTGLDHLRTPDGGARSGMADVGATYATIRALRRTGSTVPDPRAAAAYLRTHRSDDGGFAHRPGAGSDTGATLRCTQALRDLGQPVEGLGRLEGWLETLCDPGGGMGERPGRVPDLWSTHDGTATFVQVLGRLPRHADATLHLLGALQGPDGGVRWTEAGHGADVRAAYLATLVWRLLRGAGARGPSLDVDRLVGWLGDRQGSDGGFRSHAAEREPSMASTSMAVSALDALGALPSNPAGCAAWVRSQRRDDGGFAPHGRAEGSDVLASLQAIEALRTLGDARALRVPADAPAIEFLRSCQLPAGGCTHRPAVRASDPLSTAALLVVESRCATPRLGLLEGGASYLAGAQEGGAVAAVLGESGDIRSAAWAATAIDLARQAAPGATLPGLDGSVAARWLGSLQNPDGGFGRQTGRASDLAATASVLATARLLDVRDCLDEGAAKAFVDACCDHGGARSAPGGQPGCVATAAAVTCLVWFGAMERARRIASGLGRYRSRLGGFSAAPHGLGDLGSTYAAVVALQACGQPWPAVRVEDLLGRLRRDASDFAWSPLGGASGGLVPAALGSLLSEACSLAASGEDGPLPWL